jgi:RNA polymerase sigma-70 factor (ECF subfamily)
MAQQVSDSMQFHDSELAGAVAELSPQQRAVVVLHYLDDMSVIEVSAALSLSAGAVKYHLHQARERLRNILQPAPSAGSTESDDPYREGAP